MMIRIKNSSMTGVNAMSHASGENRGPNLDQCHGFGVWERLPGIVAATGSGCA